MTSASTLKSLRFYQVLGLTGLLVVFGSIGAWAASALAANKCSASPRSGSRLSSS